MALGARPGQIVRLVLGNVFVLAAATGVLLGAALLAASSPARAAARLDPTSALRRE